MANHKSAIKRHAQSLKRRFRNKQRKTMIKTFVKRVKEAIAKKDIERATEALKRAIPIIDKAASKGAIPKKRASRKISRLSRQVYSLKNTAQAEG